MYIEFSKEDYAELVNIATQENKTVKALITHTMKQKISQQEGKNSNERKDTKLQ